MSADIQKQLKTIKEVLLAPKPELKAVHAAAFELVNMLNQPERPIQAIISSEIIPRLLEFASHKRATAGFLAHTFIILGNLVSDDEDIIKYHLKRQHHIFIIEFIHEDASVLVLEYALQALANMMLASAEARDDIIRVKGLYRVMSVFSNHKNTKELRWPLCQIMEGLTTVQPYPHYPSIKCILPYLTHIFVETEICVSTLAFHHSSLHVIRNLVTMSPIKAAKDLYDVDILRAIQVNFLDEKRESIKVTDPYLILFEVFVQKGTTELVKTLLDTSTFAKLTRLIGAGGKINKRALCAIFSGLMDPKKEWGATCAIEFSKHYSVLKNLEETIEDGTGNTPEEALKVVIAMLAVHNDTVDKSILETNLISVALKNYEKTFLYSTNNLLRVLLEKNEKGTKHSEELLVLVENLLKANSYKLMDELRTKRQPDLKATLRKLAALRNIRYGSRGPETAEIIANNERKSFSRKKRASRSRSESKARKRSTPAKTTKGTRKSKESSKSRSTSRSESRKTASRKETQKSTSRSNSRKTTSKSRTATSETKKKERSETRRSEEKKSKSTRTKSRTRKSSSGRVKNENPLSRLKVKMEEEDDGRTKATSTTTSRTRSNSKKPNYKI